MINGYYLVLFIASLVCTAIFVGMWHKHVDVYYPLIYTLIPIANMGYLMMSLATNLEEAVLANKVTYLGGCFLPLIFTLNTLNLCGIRFKKIVPLGVLGFGALQYLCVLTIGNNTLYYKSVEFTVENGAAKLIRVYGPLHNLLYVNLLACLLVGCVVLFYTLRVWKKVSVKNICYLVAVAFLTVGTFLLGELVELPVDCMPAMYVFIQLLFLILTKRICLYDVSETVIDNIVQRGKYGFISLDLNLRFLGCNDTAMQYLPELKDACVDRKLNTEIGMLGLLEDWIQELNEENLEQHEQYLTIEERNYKFIVEYLYHGRKKEGYQIMVMDDTEQQQYISLLNHYREDLEREVARQTQHIELMQDKLILGMADMMESRDISTGGHIKRTSHVVRILVNELQQGNVFQVEPNFYNNLIKAAPMHDLGKLAIDDAILRKPGGFTAEEFQLMKDHAAKGAELIVKVLDGINDEEFEKIAENVAHYHHEKWDGSGYPEHLAGEQIPLEARIMAVADVCDALISKRHYKAGLPAQQAFSIIEAGMGKQFDPALREAFINAKPALEDYYASVNAQA